MLLAVNYHYIGMPEFPYSGINGISPSHFLEQVDWLKRHFRLIGLPELVDIVSSGKSLPEEDLCLITFDDGLRCQYDVAYQIANKHSFPIAIFVSKKPLSEKAPTEVHKLQYVRANTSPAEIWDSLRDYVGKRDLLTRPECISVEEACCHYSYDDDDTARLKYYINYKMSFHDQREFVDGLFSRIILDVPAFVSSWYMIEEEILEVSQRIGGIGSHAVSHRPLSHLSDQDALRELKDSKDFLTKICHQSIDVISYPLGNAKAVTLREGAYAKQVGYKAGFTMERAINNSPRCSSLLARIDCNDLPINKNLIEGPERFPIPSRSRYTRESF